MFYGIALGRVIMIYNIQNKAGLPTATVISVPNPNNWVLFRRMGFSDYVRGMGRASILVMTP